MGKVRAAAGMTLAALSLTLIACSGGDAQLSAGKPQYSMPATTAASAAVLPPPSALHAASYTAQDLLHTGGEYGDTLPHNLVTRPGGEGLFTPSWHMPGAQFADLAYATYQFQLDGFDLVPTLHFTWTQTGSFNDGWVALANFTRDSWEWSQIPSTGWMQFVPAQHISASDVMYVLVLFTGTAEWRLQQLQLGSANRGDWWMFGHDARHTMRSPITGPATNALQWSFATGDKVYSSPVIGADGTVYVGSQDCKLYAINPDGSLKWSYTAGSWLLSSPAIGADGTVYIGSVAGDSKLYAIDPAGALKWTYQMGGAITYSCPAIATSGTVYVGCDDGKLYAVNPDGSLKWLFDTGLWIRTSPAVAADGTVYVKNGFKLRAINQDGSLKWMIDLGGEAADWFPSPSIGADGTVYVGNSYNQFYAINPDGTVKWTYPINNENNTATPAIGADGTVYIGSTDSKLYALKPDGSLDWTCVVKGWIDASPAIGADGVLYVGSSSGSFYAINPDGSQQWEYITEGRFYSSCPAIGADGTVYVGSWDNKLYAFGPGGG